MVLLRVSGEDRHSFIQAPSDSRFPSNKCRIGHQLYTRVGMEVDYSTSMLGSNVLVLVEHSSQEMVLHHLKASPPLIVRNQDQTGAP